MACKRSPVRIRYSPHSDSPVRFAPGFFLWPPNPAPHFTSGLFGEPSSRGIFCEAKQKFRRRNSQIKVTGIILMKRWRLLLLPPRQNFDFQSLIIKVLIGEAWDAVGTVVENHGFAITDGREPLGRNAFPDHIFHSGFGPVL